MYAEFSITIPRASCLTECTVHTFSKKFFWPHFLACSHQFINFIINPDNIHFVTYLLRARFVRWMLRLTQVAVIAASCCVGHICMVGGGGGCSCMLLLHPVPTSAHAGPNLVSRLLHLTSWPLDLVLVVLLTGANIPLAQVVVVTSCNLCWWCFFIQPLMQILHLH